MKLKLSPEKTRYAIESALVLEDMVTESERSKIGTLSMDNTGAVYAEIKNATELNETRVRTRTISEGKEKQELVYSKAPAGEV